MPYTDINCIKLKDDETVSFDNYLPNDPVGNLGYMAYNGLLNSYYTQAFGDSPKYMPLCPTPPAFPAAVETPPSYADTVNIFDPVAKTTMSITSNYSSPSRSDFPSDRASALVSEIYNPATSNLFRSTFSYRQGGVVNPGPTPTFLNSTMSGTMYVNNFVFNAGSVVFNDRPVGVDWSFVMDDEAAGNEAYNFHYSGNNASRANQNFWNLNSTDNTYVFTLGYDSIIDNTDYSTALIGVAAADGSSVTFYNAYTFDNPTSGTYDLQNTGSVGIIHTDKYWQLCCYKQQSDSLNVLIINEFTATVVASPDSPQGAFDFTKYRLIFSDPNISDLINNNIVAYSGERIIDGVKYFQVTFVPQVALVAYVTAVVLTIKFDGTGYFQTTFTAIDALADRINAGLSGPSYVAYPAAGGFAGDTPWWVFGVFDLSGTFYTFFATPVAGEIPGPTASEVFQPVKLGGNPAIGFGKK